ncbi:MAG: homoserine dehydrogenase [Bacteroidetes bacterium]|nr:homoserine dehydrogenase [Bacteroidota bacterium]
MSNNRIGLFGFGVVGESLYRVLQQTPSLQSEIVKVAIRHPEKKRKAPTQLFTTRADELLHDESIQTIVELIDDAEAAFEIVSTALRNGKSVVSANKKMIARHLPELLRIQKESGGSLLYEAAACASIPVIRNLEEYYDNDLLQGIQGIVNGSTNYILSKVSCEQISFEEALTDAQIAGFAESDPSLDLNGTDAANKLCILLAHAYGILAAPEQLSYTGIQALHEQDAVFAREKGWAIKLVAAAKKVTDGKVAAYVLPQFVTDRHLLHTVRDEYNGVVIESGLAEQQFFYGKGAGGIATASAVLSDLSALRYDYRYAYKKLNSHERAVLSMDVFLRVYVSFDGLFQVPHELFERIEEWSSNDKRCSVVGIIHGSRLAQSDWWKQPGTSLILYPEPVVPPELLRKEPVERELVFV